ncbi:hypothetical protein LCGC14_2588880, partial [marine sediment metagenome]
KIPSGTVSWLGANGNKRKEKEIIAKLELEQILNYIKPRNLKYYLIFSLFAETGMRKGELINAKYTELNPEERFLNSLKGKKDEKFLELIEKPNVSFSKLDLSVLKCYSKIDSDYDQIYHLAAIVGVRKVTQNPVLTIRVNTLSTIYLLDFIKKMKNKPKLLFASSCENYAGSIKYSGIKIPTPEDIPLCVEDIYNPRWTYASSKILGEIACIQYSKQYNFNTTIVRYHNVYGPRMGTQHVIPEFIIRLKENPYNFEMFGGYQYRSFCYVEDAAKITTNLMNNPMANNLVVNIGSEHSILISCLAKKLFHLMNIAPDVIEKGAPKGSIEKRQPNLELIKRLGEYVSKTTFDEGLKKTYEWYNEIY